MKRPEVTRSNIIWAKQMATQAYDWALENIDGAHGVFASGHEVLGKLKEEFDEFSDAVHANAGREALIGELQDIIVIAMHSLASITSNEMDIE